MPSSFWSECFECAPEGMHGRVLLWIATAREAVPAPIADDFDMETVTGACI